MNECTYKNYDELPLMLNVVQVAAVLAEGQAAGVDRRQHNTKMATL